jgi:hypothetical protein
MQVGHALWLAKPDAVKCRQGHMEPVSIPQDVREATE